jgi:hypothetical protein
MTLAALRRVFLVAFLGFLLLLLSATLSPATALRSPSQATLLAQAIAFLRFAL